MKKSEFYVLPRKSAYDVFGGVQIQQPKAPDELTTLPGGSRRSSFRITDNDFEKDESPSPDKSFDGPTLLIDDDRRIRRRGSQL